MAKQYGDPMVESCPPEAELLEPEECDEQSLLGNAAVAERLPACPPEEPSDLLAHESAQPEALDKGEKYCVREGDTIASIAENETGDATDALRIAAANPSHVGPQGEVTPGDTLWIPPHDTENGLRRGAIRAMARVNSGGVQYPTESLDLGNGEEMHPGGYTNPDYWEPAGELEVRLRHGKSASQGVRSLISGPTRCDCAVALHAVQASSILRVVGAEAFDARFGAEGKNNQDLILGGGMDGGLHDFVSKVPLEDPAMQLQEGDQVYFENSPVYRKKHPAGFWQGENAVVVGKNGKGEWLFSGFGAVKKTDKEMRVELAEALNAPPDEADREHPDYEPAFDRKLRRNPSRERRDR